jgi:type III restriction enzyme
MSLTVDQPILNSPFREPQRYWLYEQETGLPRVAPGRRPAGYYYRDPARAREASAQLSMLADEHFVELELVNRIREQVRGWRNNGYPGVTHVTRRLLEHWMREGRERQLFFCQREAAETIIWLTETETGRRIARTVPIDVPTDPESRERGYGPLTRLCTKMATGSGKTVVMAMVIAWSVLNKVHAPRSQRYSDAVLVLCPNLTIKERLGGAPRDSDLDGPEPQRPLVPGARGNYYEQFDLVPPGLLPELGQARIHITNWHALAIADDGGRRGVVQRGRESDAAFCARVLRDLGSRNNLLVINDEAHHAYRPKALDDESERLAGLTAEERAALRREKEEATVWVSGLDRINAVRGINLCLDLSATPFYIQGSGYEESTPFPWVVSDFGLVDAIESGIVKIPRVPVADDTGRPEPRYFRLWKWIVDHLPPAERGGTRRKPKPEAVLREAEGALQQLAGLWVANFESWQQGAYPTPPALIVVGDSTDIAKVVYEHIALHGHGALERFRNQPGEERTLRIDSKLLADADFAEASGSREAAAEQLRRKVATVGKPGEPGADVRCVVSVGMLTEGWDANNVTQILGLRAFQSQLLCEQVVGRGLRRLSYDFDLDEHGIPTNEEYVDVYGIPFEVIPVKKRPQQAPPPPKPTTLVQALKERERYAIEFPRVEGYVFAVTDRISANLAGIEPVYVEPSVEPTQVIARPKVGYELGQPSLHGVGEVVTQTRQEFYTSIRLQEIEYEIARRLTESLVQRDEFALRARHVLFPQVLRIVRAFVATKVSYGGADWREIGLVRYVDEIVVRLATAIRPGGDGDAKLLPRIERFRPRGSTAEVGFRTGRDVRGTVKSHISHVVLDTATWEASAAFYLEASPLVEAYARNDHLDLTVPYEHGGAQHSFLPDFVVRLTDGTRLLLEVKGMEAEQDRQKYEAAKRWCEAVSNWGELGRWEFRDCRRVADLPKILAEVAGAQLRISA